MPDPDKLSTGIKNCSQMYFNGKVNIHKQIMVIGQIFVLMWLKKEKNLVDTMQHDFMVRNCQTLCFTLQPHPM